MDQQPQQQLKRLANDNYDRPKQTIQEKMTDQEIAEKLRNYEKVDTIMTIDVGTHVRYFSNINGMLKYRSGGNLIKKDKEGRYVVLSNGRASWSVQTGNSIFYRELSIEDVRESHKREIQEYEAKLAQYKATIKSLKKELVKYKPIS